MQTMGRFDLGGGLTILLPYPCLILYPCSPSIQTSPPPPLLLYLLHLPLSLSLFFIRDARARLLKAVQILLSPSPIETFDTGLTQFAPLLIPTIILC